MACYTYGRIIYVYIYILSYNYTLLNYYSSGKLKCVYCRVIPSHARRQQKQHQTSIVVIITSVVYIIFFFVWVKEFFTHCLEWIFCHQWNRWNGVRGKGEISPPSKKCVFVDGLKPVPFCFTAAVLKMVRGKPCFLMDSL